MCTEYLPGPLLGTEAIAVRHGNKKSCRFESYNLVRKDRQIK